MRAFIVFALVTLVCVLAWIGLDRMSDDDDDEP